MAAQVEYKEDAGSSALYCPTIAGCTFYATQQSERWQTACVQHQQLDVHPPVLALPSPQACAAYLPCACPLLKFAPPAGCLATSIPTCCRTVGRLCTDLCAPVTSTCSGTEDALRAVLAITSAFRAFVLSSPQPYFPGGVTGCPLPASLLASLLAHRAAQDGTLPGGPSYTCRPLTRMQAAVRLSSTLPWCSLCWRSGCAM